MRSFIIVIGTCLVITSNLIGQIIATNKGDTLYIGPNLVFTVEGGFLNQANGKVFNEGEMFIQDTLYNNAGNTMFFNNLPGKVYLYGNDQVMGGQDPIHFYDLILTGNGVKSMDNHEFVNNSLNLNDLQLQTRNFTMYITNPDPNSVLRNNGYVSSYQNGYFQRTMNQTTGYLFPTGEPAKYRPIIITPSVTARDSFGVRFANLDATTENFDRSQKDTTLCLVNPDYYHWIRKAVNNNAPAQIEMFFDPADPVKETMAHWHAGNYWENMSPVTTNPNSLTKTAWLAFQPVPFAFALNKPVANITNAVSDFCSDASPITLNATPAGGTFSGNGVVGNTFDPAAAGPGTHIVQYIYNAPNGCADTAFFTFNIRQAPNPHFGNTNLEFCEGQTHTLQLNGTYSSYQWYDQNGNLLGTSSSLTVSQSGQYYVVVDSNQCTAHSDTVSILFKPNPNPVITPNRNTNLCAGETVILDAGAGYNTYTWLLNGVPTGQTTQTLTVSTAGTYTVMVDSNGCSAISNPVIVTVRNLPQATISVNGPLTFCEGKGSVTLTASPADGYLWSTGEQTQSITVTQSGTYEVTITDSCGTATSAPVTVTVHANPIANFTSDPEDTTFVFTTIQFTDLSSQDVITWSWNFGNGQTSNLQNPNVEYTAGGNYPVILTVSNGNCTDSITKYIFVSDATVLWVPTAFTPNNDGLNDTWDIYSKNITDFSLTVWNRWGELIFQTNDPAFRWNGTFNGKPVQEDAYTFVVKATTLKGKKIQKLGTVTIIR